MKKTSLIVLALLIGLLSMALLIWTSFKPQRVTTTVTPAPILKGIPQSLATPQALYEGKLLFMTSCAECHGNQAQGSRKGPNLIDEYWIKGPQFTDICTQIETGSPGKMPGWKQSLRQEDIQKIAAFILASQHTHPPYSYKPEGKKCRP